MKRNLQQNTLPLVMGPPLPVGRYEAENTCSDPHWAGPIEVQFKPCEIQVRWLGETEWKSVTWHEIMYVADALPIPIVENIEYLKQEAVAEAYAVGLARALKEWQSKVMGRPFLASYGDSVKEAIAAIDSVFEKYPRLKECL